MKKLIIGTALILSSFNIFAIEKEIEINGQDAIKIMNILKKNGAYEEHAMGGRYGFSAKEVFCHRNINDRSIKKCRLTIQTED